MNPKDTQWPPLGVQDLQPDQSVNKDKVRFPVLKAALEKARLKKS